MGYFEAVRDNITIVQKPNITLYYPKCTLCGETVERINYKAGINYLCSRCKAIDYLADREHSVELNQEVKDRKFKNAVSRIQKVAKHFEKYDSAIKAAQKALHNYGWFDSTEEIMVAIELLKCNIDATHHVRYGSFEVDFVLHGLKAVLEIDGHVYHTAQRKTTEKARDNAILLLLGAEWEIVRISDNLINENITKLIPAINGVLKERKKQRELNGGLLPQWYSTTTV